MTELTAGDPERTTKDQTPPGPASIALRPVGYLLVGLVWLTIWLFAVGILVGSVLYLAYDDPESFLAVDGRSPLAQGTVLVVMGLLVGLVVGPGGWHVLTASWPLAVLSFTYAVRSLRPSYARERLSFTGYAVRGSTFGPPTVGDVAMSLQPVRPSRFTDALMRFYLAGWTVSVRMLLAMVPAGLAWPLAIVAVTPVASERAHLVAGVLAVVLLLVSLVLGVRAFRLGDFDAGRAAGAGAHGRAGQPDGADRTGPDAGVTSASPEQLARRRELVKKQRAKRLRQT
ncbi:hypothetical protein ACFS27_07520 [Promicromonospora vindobonensis]|uniref:DUF4389 domain-containing protein n=1 Tax=Promicromonospora vindobonensis TaxID=195748 RepID=A0ABW5VQ25_9MICO